jgi:ABC-2 type transport system permease protein
MKKILLIGVKDLKVIFRDRAALVLMLAAPFVLAVGLGLVTGQFGGGTSSGIGQIPVILVNQDQDVLGDELVALFQSAQLAELIVPTTLDDPAAARQQVDDDKATAALIVPVGFTQSIISPEDQEALDVVQIELVANPTRPTGVGVVKTILDDFISRLEVGRVGGTVAVTQLLTSGLIAPDQAAALGMEIGRRQAETLAESNVIQLQRNTSSQSFEFKPLAYLMPGMALMFLMFTVSTAGRTLLVEGQQGTLPRLLASPTSVAQILGGKVFGVYLSGVVQMMILIVASALLFQLTWGDWLGVVVLVLAAVFGASGWGLLITAVADTPGKVSAYGSAIMLIFGLLGGSFIDLEIMPPVVQWISKITPNAWGLDGFATLALGGKLANILTPVLALLVMGIVLFAAALVLFNRHGLTRR